MQILAFMPVFNEADILEASVTHLASRGIRTHVLDNWSTDGSWVIARQLQECGIADIERVPTGGPPSAYDLFMMRDRVVELSMSSNAEWFIWNDADEYIHTALATTSLPDALEACSTSGFNAVEQLVAHFPAVDDGYPAGADFVAYFRHWRAQRQSGARPWVRVWRRTGDVPVFRGGNHEIDFAGRRIAPVPFILRHYPLRSQQHALRKIFVERRPRFTDAERTRGWHTHYDAATADQSFLEQPETLQVLDERTFAAQVFAALGRAVPFA
jgi:hypothetical protein